MWETLWNGKYAVIAEIGKYRSVKLLLDQENKKMYVGKCLSVFDREVYDRLCSIRNVHISKLLEYREEQGKLYTVEEYISGETLEEKLAYGTVISEEQTVDWMIQLCQALECLHSQIKPLIHRDIKPSNVCITDDGILKLIDYNAARSYETGAVKDTVLIGTNGYAAPEQYGFAQTDARTDLYACGVLMNQMLTGKSIIDVCYGGKLGRIIKKCTYIDPEKRYQNVQSLKRDLEQIKISWDEKGTGQQSALQSFWPIPGFRSGNLSHMILALIGYLFCIAIASGLEVETNMNKPLILFLDRICMGIWLFSLIALGTNYAGIEEMLPLMRAEKRWKRIAGWLLFGTLGLIAAATFPEIVSVIFYG